ncbi:MAG: hypothetical protein ACRDS0_13820 [Pseudonocardiaceae bacterium]
MTDTDPIVVARTPLRLSLGGGGTDLPFYRSQFGADVLSVAISPQVTVVGRKGRLDATTRFGYERLCVADKAGELADPFVSAAMDMVGFREPCELFSLGPVPAGTGLGSSGAFAVSLLAVLNTLSDRSLDRIGLIEQACELEIDRLGRPVGKHDQYVCGLGGLRRLVISTTGAMHAEPARIDRSTVDELVRRLLLVYTGVRRDSAASLSISGSGSDLDARIAQLHRIRDVGDRIRKALEGGEWERTPELLREHWSIKRGRERYTPWDALCQTARANGATAWKLVGAGGGGFILFWAEPERQADVLSAISAFGVRHLPFRVAEMGTTVTRIDTHAVEVQL